jgi:hypothetical protein
MTDPTAPRCLEASDPRHACKGAVEYRESLSGTGTPIPRCDAAWSDALDRHERITRDYPDSPNPPSWFDASYAGETWDVDA